MPSRDAECYEIISYNKMAITGPKLLADVKPKNC